MSAPDTSAGRAATFTRVMRDLVESGDYSADDVYAACDLIDALAAELARLRPLDAPTWPDDEGGAVVSGTGWPPWSTDHQGFSVFGDMTEAQVDYLNRSRALIAELRVTLGCPDGESLLWHAERVMGELHRLRDERRAAMTSTKEGPP